MLPAVLGRTNRHHVPVAGLAVFLVLSALVVSAAGAYDQRLVLFYAVAVFVSFLMGLTAMLKFETQARRWGWVTLNAAATIAVGFTLVANLTRRTGRSHLSSPRRSLPRVCTPRGCA